MAMDFKRFAVEFGKGYFGTRVKQMAAITDKNKFKDELNAQTNEHIRRDNNKFQNEQDAIVAKEKKLEDEAYRVALGELGDEGLVEDLKLRGKLKDLQSYIAWKSTWQNFTQKPDFYNIPGFIDDLKKSRNLITSENAERSLVDTNNLSTNVAKSQVEDFINPAMQGMIKTKDIPAGVSQVTPSEKEKIKPHWADKYAPATKLTVPSTKAVVNLDTNKQEFATEEKIQSNPNLVPIERDPTKEKGVMTDVPGMYYFTDVDRIGKYYKRNEKGENVEVPLKEYQDAVAANKAQGDIQNYGYFNPKVKEQLAQLKNFKISGLDAIIENAEKNNQVIQYEMINGKPSGMPELISMDDAENKLDTARNAVLVSINRGLTAYFPGEIRFDETSQRSIPSFAEGAINQAKYSYFVNTITPVIDGLIQNGYIPSADRVLNAINENIGYINNVAYNWPAYNQGLKNEDIALSMFKAIEGADDIDLVQNLLVNKTWQKQAKELPGNENIDFAGIAKELRILIRDKEIEDNPFMPK